MVAGVAAAIGMAVGACLAVLAMAGRLRAKSRTVAGLRSRLAEAGADQAALTELRAHLSGLRHDIRGILSPALLVADRLMTNQDAGVRRAGEVMVRTVDRATARLGEAKLDRETAAVDRP